MEGISAAGSHMQYGIKALLGILSVVLMEVAVVRLKKHSASVNVLLVVTLILIIAAVIMGSALPLGMLSF